MKRLFALGIAIILIAATTVLYRKKPPVCCPGAGAPARDSLIGEEPSITSDTLENGLRYYLAPFSSQDNRTVVRLVVNAGAVHEESTHFGIAHAVEHMTMRGSRRFPGRAIDEYIQSLGLRGEGANATTSMDETIFRLAIPADREGSLDTALAMLAGIAGEATFDTSDTRPESGILLEEWRSGRDVYQRAADAQQSVLLAGTPYANRSVIGDTTVLQRLDVDAMRRFYEKWYRPDLMAVVVVGDIDLARTEEMMRTHFGGLQRRPSPVTDLARTQPLPKLPLRATAVKDDEATDTRISLWFPRAAKPYRTREDFRNALIAAIWRDILYTRLNELTLQPDAALLLVELDHQALARGYDAPVVGAVGRKGREADALNVLTVEVDHLARDGVTQTELNESVLALFRASRANLESIEDFEALASELTDHFLTGDAVIGQARRFELYRDLLPTISLDDIAAYARTLTIGDGTVVTVFGNSDNALSALSPDDVVARVTDALASGSSVRRPPDEPARSILLSEPSPGRVTEVQQIAGAGIHSWTLSNGMKIVLKPTSFAYNEVQFRLVAPGGASLASAEDYPSAFLSDVLFTHTGYGAMSASRLARWISAKSTETSFTVTDAELTIEGSTEPADLESFFQLIHAMITSPRDDSVAFQRFQDRARTARLERPRNPDNVFLDTLSSIIGHHHYSVRSHTPGFVDQTSLQRALAFWRARMSNGSNFTVAMTGDFTLSRVRPLIERYLGSIPAGTRESPNDMGLRFPAGVTRADVRSGVSERARTVLAFSDTVSLSPDLGSRLSALEDVLELALQTRLRESLGGTYGVDVQYSFDLVPPYTYTLTIDFESAPGRIEALVSVALDELERLRGRGPTRKEFEATRAGAIRDFDGLAESNEYWVAEIATHAQFGWPLDSIAHHPAQAEAMTLEDLVAICRAFIRTGNYVRVTMRPEARR